MCLAFSPKEIYEFVFSHADDLPDTHRLGKESIAEFCDILCRDLRARTGFRYTYIDLGQDRLDEFFMLESERFVDLGDEVAFLGECTDEMARRVEAGYEGAYGDLRVGESLRIARRIARQSDTARRAKRPDGWVPEFLEDATEPPAAAVATA